MHSVANEIGIYSHQLHRCISLTFAITPTLCSQKVSKHSTLTLLFLTATSE